MKHQTKLMTMRDESLLQKRLNNFRDILGEGYTLTAVPSNGAAKTWDVVVRSDLFPVEEEFQISVIRALATHLLANTTE